MHPTLQQGDFVFVIKQRDYNIGDILVLRREGGHTAHRLVESKLMQGDALFRSDDFQLTDQNNIAGKVVKILFAADRGLISQRKSPWLANTKIVQRLCIANPSNHFMVVLARRRRNCAHPGQSQNVFFCAERRFWAALSRLCGTWQRFVLIRTTAEEPHHGMPADQ